MPKTNKTVDVRSHEGMHIQELIDMIALSVIKVNTGHFVCDNTYRYVWGRL